MKGMVVDFVIGEKFVPLARNVAALGPKRLMISRAKLSMKTNQLDLRAAFFIFPLEYNLSEAIGRL
jgi:hypothetical protein